MNIIYDYPEYGFFGSFFAMWLSAWVAWTIRRRRGELTEDERADFSVVLGAALTLLVLLIGFCFSMAIGRYDQRKNYEEAEANAIGTELVRAGLLPPNDTTTVRALLKQYLDKRISFYVTSDEPGIRAINSATAKLQNDLWSAVQVVAESRPTPVVALTAMGMNDVLNSQGYTQASWWNRIPHAAWGLMALIAICCNFLMGYGARAGGILLAILPLIVSIAFLLIADIDSPRGGLIHVYPQNLMSLSRSIPAP
jgi:hypothetical protein